VQPLSGPTEVELIRYGEKSLDLAYLHAAGV